MGKKLVITGYLALLQPGQLIQIYIALVVALCLLILQLRVQPYRSKPDEFLGFTSSTMLVFVLLCTLSVQTANKTTTSGFADVTYFAILLFATSLSVILAALIMLLSDLASAHALPLARWVSDGDIASPAPLETDGFHAFVSHEWSGGQDQAKTIKSSLISLVPGLRVFLDVDDLTSTTELESFVARSDVVIVFLSGSSVDDRSLYFASKNCLRELRNAIALGKPLVFVLETDPQHGGVPLAMHLRDCPPDVRPALDVAVVVPWLRMRAFQQVCLRLILSPCLRQLRPTDELYISGEVLTQRPTSRVSLTLEFSQHNIGAEAISALVANEAHECSIDLRVDVWSRAFRSLAVPRSVATAPFPALFRRATSVAALSRVEAEHQETTNRVRPFLLYLCNGTFSGSSAAALEADLKAVLERGSSEVSLLLVHEQRTTHDATNFDSIISQTPPAMISLGVYASLATPLYSEELQHVSLRLLLNKLCKAGMPKHQKIAQSLKRAAIQAFSPNASVCGSPLPSRTPSANESVGSSGRLSNAPIVAQVGNVSARWKSRPHRGIRKNLARQSEGEPTLLQSRGMMSRDDASGSGVGVALQHLSGGLTVHPPSEHEQRA